MQVNNSWKGDGPSGSPSNTDRKYSRMKHVTKTAVKKFGPFVLTGLAAIAEHHWLKKEDSVHSQHEDIDRRPRKDHYERSEIQTLKEEVADLKKSLRGKERQSGERQPPPGSPRPPSLVRDPRSLYDQEEQRELPRERSFDRMPFAPTPPVSFPAPFAFPEVRSPKPEFSEHPGLAREYYDRGMHRSSFRKRHGRHLSVPRHLPHHHDVSDGVWQAGKVAAVAGLVEALHVDDGKGDWIGRKGLRVGTTAAASFSATFVRDRDSEDYRAREVLADVGTGVLVSRLVYGRARKGEEVRRPDGKKRRWSYCY